MFSEIESDGYAVIRGPYLVSNNPLYLRSGEIVSFDYKVKAGRDAYDAFGYLVNECNVPASQIILYGQSVGSGPSVYLATIYQCLGLVLHAGLLSGLRVLTPNRCCLCCCDIFPNVDRMPKVKCPTFIIHGIEDAQIHVSHGMGLYEKTPDKYKVDPWFVEGADHNNVVYTNFRPYFFKMK